jgi:hypothetical protein
LANAAGAGTLAASMAGDDDLNTTQWAAVIAVLLLLTVPVAVALAAWFKRRYARAVVALQASTARGAVPATEPAEAVPTGDAGAVAAPLTIDLRPAAGAGEADATDPTRPSRRLRRRVLAVQFTSGLLYWWALVLCLVGALLVLTEAMGQADDPATDASAWATNMVLWPLLVLPAALAWAFQAGVRESRVWAVAGASMAAFGVGLAMAGTGWLASGVFALACALLALMLAAFMRPAVRGAGPPLVAAFTVGVLVLCALLAVVAQFDDSSDDGPMTGQDWAIAAGALAVLLPLSGFAAWRMLLRLARRYGEKRFSELQLALGAYWGLITAFAVGAVLFLSFEEKTKAVMEWFALGILLLWLLWRWLQRGALWLARRRAPPPIGPLLLLRVFKPSQRAEAFTERFLAHWRFAAPVWMIAGPDLAGAFMEPDEFFAYLRRRLHERFIAEPSQVADRLAALDDARDPDGRFRVNELFCADTTWQPVVLTLIERAGVVLLDLREYTRQRAGTRFELVELLRRAPLRKVLVIVAASDDAAQVRAEITSIWDEVGSGRRGGADGGAHTLQVLQLGDGSDAEMRGLFRAAAAAASATT